MIDRALLARVVAALEPFVEWANLSDYEKDPDHWTLDSDGPHYVRATVSDLRRARSVLNEVSAAIEASQLRDPPSDPGTARATQGAGADDRTPPVGAGPTAPLIDIVFDGPPSHVSGRFVEVESPPGKSIRLGKWLQRADGYWVLRFNAGEALEGS